MTKRLTLLTLFFISTILVLNGCKKETLKQAPYFEVTDITGKEHRLTDYKGKKLVLIFWGTWCPTCKDALKILNEKAKEYQSKNTEILAVSVDDNREKVISTVKEFNFNNLTIAIATPQMIMDFQGVRFIPTCYVIDGNTNTILKRYVGEIDFKELDNIISK